MAEPLARLFINHIPELDWLVALEFGRVDDGQPHENWIGAHKNFGYLCDTPRGRFVGFKIVEFSNFNLNVEAVPAIWGPPYFDAPTLGLAGASAARIAHTVRTTIGRAPTVNRVFFSEAVSAHDPPEQVDEWISCLEAGDCMAHYGLGIALLECNQPGRAYIHLSYYATIAPSKAWAHHWHGRAATAVGELEEARIAFKRSLELETDEELMNQSRILLSQLGG